MTTSKKAFHTGLHFCELNCLLISWMLEPQNEDKVVITIRPLFIISHVNLYKHALEIQRLSLTSVTWLR